MFLLEDFIFNAKMKFNNEIISLKNRKKNIIEKVKDYNQKIMYINKELNIYENLFVPQIDWDLEYPEKKFEVSVEEIDQVMLSR